MEGKLQRAVILHEHRRYEESLALLAEILAEDPEDDFAHFLRSENFVEMQGQNKKALEALDEAIALDPEATLYLGKKSFLLSLMDRDREALKLAEQAIALEPDEAIGWIAKAQALGGLTKWIEAEEAIREALELEPDNTMAANLLTLFLRVQNKLDDSHEESEKRLAKDAEDPFSLANMGWSYLQRGERSRAEELFRDALRVDPEFDYAREGLMECFKSRSPVYRLYLKWVFFLQRFSDGKQFLIIIGVYLAYRFSQSFMHSIHPAVGGGFTILYLVFALGSWVARGVGNLLIFMDSKTRLVLTKREILDALFVGGSFSLGFLVLLVGVFIEPLNIAIAGGILMGSSIPVSLIFLNRSYLGCVVFSLVTLALYGIIVAVLLGASGLLLFAALLIFVTTLIGFLPALRKGDAMN